jgi:hypothetical protein
MSRDTRLDKLESAVVDALRRAPGAEPSAELDARIRARAHAAVAKPARRAQPIWFSMAAGLVVLVGSGLALRIWQQVEHAPTALDAPTPAASTPGPAVPATVDDNRAAATSMGAAAESSERDAPARAQSETAAFAPAKPADQPRTLQPGGELRREQVLVESKREALNDLAASPQIADPMLSTPEARPFPAEPSPVSSPREEAPPSASSAPMAAAESLAPPPPPPSVAAHPALPAPAAPRPMQAPASTADSGIAQPASVGQAQAAKMRASEGAAIAGRDAAAADELELDAAGERQRAAGEVAHDEAFSVAVAAVREAIAAGDIERARRLAADLRRDYPQHELPKDMLELVDAPR